MYFMSYGVSAALAIAAQVKLIVNPFMKTYNSDMNTMFCISTATLFIQKQWSPSNGKKTAVASISEIIFCIILQDHSGLLKWGYVEKL